MNPWVIREAYEKTFREVSQALIFFLTGSGTKEPQLSWKSFRAVKLSAPSFTGDTVELPRIVH